MSADPPHPDEILVAIDGSPAAHKAAEAAIRIAQGLHWGIEGLYVVDALIMLGQSTDYLPELGEPAQFPSAEELLPAFEKRGDRALQWLEERCRTAGVRVTTHMLMGGIPEMAEQGAARAKMIALGRRGFMHVEDATHLGENFRIIAHHTRLPLLVGGDERPSFERLLLAYDGSERARHALDWAVRLQQAFSSDVAVLVAKENPIQTQPAPETVQEDLDQSGLASYRMIHRVGEPAGQIIAAAAEIRAHTILMGGYRHGAFLEWLVGSTVDRVLRGTRLPVLVA